MVVVLLVLPDLDKSRASSKFPKRDGNMGWNDHTQQFCLRSLTFWNKFHDEDSFSDGLGPGHGADYRLGDQSPYLRTFLLYPSSQT